MSSRARTGSNEGITRAVLLGTGATVLSVAYIPSLHDRMVTGKVTCPILLATGWQCPFCGMTRGTVALLHGDVLASLRFNAFAWVFVFGLLALGLGAWGVRAPEALRRRAAIPISRWGPPLAAVFVLYAVGRNVI